ncbi:MAG TPA: phenol hydroxylase [Thermopetrobacter sp.]|nr:phenol hydroxylase [Thermopetrobacter sp.]
MQIDIKAREIKPVRQTYTHLKERFGDKPMSRYQEAIYDVQARENFHYRPTWEPDRELFDPARTRITMGDWYKFLDPRQYYYGAYCITRGRQQDSVEQNFRFVEKRGLVAAMRDENRALVLTHVVPLRHYEWGAYLNNNQICHRGYGTALTAAAQFHAADRLGNAQYLTRMALLLTGNDPAALEAGHGAWMDNDAWQPLRRLMEDSLVVEDWFELFVAQNIAMDGLVHPLFFDRLEKKMTSQGDALLAMLTEFTAEWFAEEKRWADRQIQVAAAENPENKALLSGWYGKWRDLAVEAAKPLAGAVLGDAGEAEAIAADMDARMRKAGLEV